MTILHFVGAESLDFEDVLVFLFEIFYCRFSVRIIFSKYKEEIE